MFKYLNPEDNYPVIIRKTDNFFWGKLDFEDITLAVNIKDILSVLVYLVMKLR